MIVVASSCPHHRRVSREAPAPCCIAVAPTDDPECPWCVWVNRGRGGPEHTVVPGAWTRCEACGGTGVLRPRR